MREFTREFLGPITLISLPVVTLVTLALLAPEQKLTRGEKIERLQYLVEFYRNEVSRCREDLIENRDRWLRETLREGFTLERARKIYEESIKICISFAEAGKNALEDLEREYEYIKNAGPQSLHEKSDFPRPKP